jgi:hypothetical protein
MVSQKFISTYILIYVFMYMYLYRCHIYIYRCYMYINLYYMHICVNAQMLVPMRSLEGISQKIINIELISLI